MLLAHQRQTDTRDQPRHRPAAACWALLFCAGLAAPTFAWAQTANTPPVNRPRTLLFNPYSIPTSPVGGPFNPVPVVTNPPPANTNPAPPSMNPTAPPPPPPPQKPMMPTPPPAPVQETVRRGSSGPMPVAPVSVRGQSSLGAPGTGTQDVFAAPDPRKGPVSGRWPFAVQGVPFVAPQLRYYVSPDQVPSPTLFVEQVAPPPFPISLHVVPAPAPLCKVVSCYRERVRNSPKVRYPWLMTNRDWTFFVDGIAMDMILNSGRGFRSPNWWERWQLFCDYTGSQHRCVECDLPPSPSAYTGMAADPSGAEFAGPLPDGRSLSQVDPFLAEVVSDAGPQASKARSLRPSDAAYYTPADRLRASMELGEFAMAANAAREMLELNPQDHHARRALGLALIAQGQTDEGARLIREAYEQDPTLAARPWPARANEFRQLDLRRLAGESLVIAGNRRSPDRYAATLMMMQANATPAAMIRVADRAESAGLPTVVCEAFRAAARSQKPADPRATSTNAAAAPRAAQR